jgi:N-acylneuraminate cytidylyltransferase
MNAIAIIPARGGSRGVPRKNLCEVGGKPLMVWSIQAALEAGLEVVVSSDDDEILEMAARDDVLLRRRPYGLATDGALTDPVLVDAVNALGRPELSHVVLLQPTVPVRSVGLVARCLQVAEETGADSVFTAYPLHFVWWRAGMDPGRTDHRPDTWETQCRRRPRRQDMHARELMYHEDGSVYVTRVQTLLETGSRVAGRVEIVETERTVDVDTEADLIVADALLRARA